MPDPDWRTLDRAALSAAYDNSGAVPGSADTMAALRARSAAFRAGHPHCRELAYGERERERIDLFGCGSADAPLLVFIHGGYWQRNAKEGFSSLAEGPLARGLDVALVGYTLCPETTLTGIADEVRAALARLRAHDAEAGRMRRLVVSGWSAGGHLAALATAWPEVDAGLAVSGIFDLEPIRGTALDDALRLSEGEVEALSPIRHLPTIAGPLTVAFGTRELPELRRQSTEYHAAWTGHGLSGDLLPLDDDHFSILDRMIRPDGALTDAAVRLARG
ncbi:alpha/beta hydrolase [Methylobacterium oryzihabitans]|uniref:Alpha/beta hydrolase n=1 Tax=Methylobacterium oryzihabitans TaxID=2499852 RepID=A0A3S2VTQ3_9HYPH|nr:alpha/beta hydrolase [Methylobacterium oryzihabitans]RVU17200.1 alpha/beta hydrolase [Methylobacterium oryzihabitans]